MEFMTYFYYVQTQAGITSLPPGVLGAEWRNTDLKKKNLRYAPPVGRSYA